MNILVSEFMGTTSLDLKMKSLLIQNLSLLNKKLENQQNPQYILKM